MDNSRCLVDISFFLPETTFWGHVWGQKTSSEKPSWTLFQMDSIGLSRPAISLVQVEGGPHMILNTFTLT